MAAIEPGSEDLNDLTKAHQHIRRCVSGIQQFRTAVLGVYGPELPPLPGFSRPKPPVAGPRVDELQRAVQKLAGLVSAGRDILGPVASEFTALTSGPVGAHGVYGPNAHAAVLNLAEDLLHDRERGRTLDPAELNRLWAEAEREYHAACRNRRAERPLGPSASAAPAPGGPVQFDAAGRQVLIASGKVYPSAEMLYRIGCAGTRLATALNPRDGKCDLAAVFKADEALWRLVAEVEPADPLEGVPHAEKLRKQKAN